MELSNSWLAADCWRGLMVCAAEDVGLADPMTLVLATSGWIATKESTKGFSKPPGMKLEFLGQVVLYLCRCPKNRETDDAIVYTLEQRKRGLRVEVPGHAQDAHTAAGRRLGCGEQFWFAESRRPSRFVEIEGKISTGKT